MRKLFVSAVMVLACAAVAGADDKKADAPMWKCYSPLADGKGEIFQAEAMTHEAFSTHFPDAQYRYPVPKPPKDYSKAKQEGPAGVGKPWRITWGGFAEGVSVQEEVVGNYKGHAIYMFLYVHRLLRGEPDWTFDRAVLAYEVGDGKDDGTEKLLRPFFIMSGEGVRRFAAQQISTGEHPDAIEIRRTVMRREREESTLWVMELEKGGPRLVEWMDTGREKADVTYHYNKGKIAWVDGGE
jgi:hypothetical protein